MRLSELSIGQSGIIASSPKKNLPLRLVEMGIDKGQVIRLLHRTLFGDPLLFATHNITFALEKKIADNIFVNASPKNR